MREITNEVKEEIRKMVYEFLADECEVDESQITDDTMIIDELDGDSLMFVEMIEIIKKKYDLAIQMQNVGKYLLKNPAEKVSEVIETCYLVYEKENDIVQG